MDNVLKNRKENFFSNIRKLWFADDEIDRIDMETNNDRTQTTKEKTLCFLNKQVDLKDTIHKTMIQILPCLEEKDIDLDINLEESYVVGDGYLLAQVIDALCGYAIQHTTRGGHIQLNCYKLDKVRFEIEYEGIPERREDEPQLNLQQCKEIIELHDGIFGTKNIKHGVCTYFII